MNTFFDTIRRSSSITPKSKFLTLLFHSIWIGYKGCPQLGPSSKILDKGRPCNIRWGPSRESQKRLGNVWDPGNPDPPPPFPPVEENQPGPPKP